MTQEKLGAGPGADGQRGRGVACRRSPEAGFVRYSDETASNASTALTVSAVEALLAVSSDCHEPGFTQSRQVLRDTRIAQVQTTSELSDRQLVAPDQPQDALPMGFWATSCRASTVVTLLQTEKRNTL